MTYTFKAIETAAQDFWHHQQSFRMDPTSTQPFFYCLAMFPYPSGNLHMGHVRNYVLADIIARYKMMSGHNVLFPMGWDAFGLPAENAAKQHHISPQIWTYHNIDKMRRDFQRIGLGFDWSREIFTCDPSYYRHQQWFFIQLYLKGLVYRKKSLVYWDPVDQTVLAHEQVIEGRGWRSQVPVELKEQEQWYVWTQPYAEELEANLAQMTHWPAALSKIQKNWIGKSTGWQITYRLQYPYRDLHILEVFTTKLETIFGVVCLMLATQHPLALQLAQEYEEIAQFLQKHTVIYVKDQATQGMRTPLQAIHPLSGQTLDIWIVNFVSFEYATGVVGCVPAHSKIDYAFAQTYALPVVAVIDAAGHLIHSPGFNGLTQAAAPLAIAQRYPDVIKPKTYFRLKDWCVSRQREWGCPIPMLYCPQCGIVPEIDANLPVTLEQKHTPGRCPKCAGIAQREQDTLDTFFDSSWYFIRYLDPYYPHMVNPATLHWLPIDLYVGGIEHANLHLLYARLFFKMMRDLGIVRGDEPFKRLLPQGMILSHGEKMSKSKGNTVLPQEIIAKYGADSTRLLIAVAAPPQQDFEWSEKGIIGMQRFLGRVVAFCSQVQLLSDPRALQETTATGQALHGQIAQCVNQTLNDIEEYKLNTALSFCIKILQLLKKYSFATDLTLIRTDLPTFLKLLHPFAPHLTHHLWIELGFGVNILRAPFPSHTTASTLRSHVMLQVDSKNVCLSALEPAWDEAQLLIHLLQIPKFQQVLGKRQVHRIIYIPGKIVNVVTK